MMRYMPSMDEALTTPMAIRPKVGRVPAASPAYPGKTEKTYVASRSRSSLLQRLAIATTCAVLFVAAAALSFKSGKGVLGNVSVSDALASTFSSAPAPAPKPVAGAVMIQEENGTIVGQLTKIAPENEQVTEIKTASSGNRSVREDLLSIIGKY